ncbi:MAG: alpha/beta hydrolase [Steroidobacteraceae bacterium]
MPLDRHVKRILDMLAAGAPSEPAPPDVLQLRQDMERLARAVDARDIPIGAVENRCLPGPAGALPFRLYVPAGIANPHSPALIFFHGGAGVSGSLDTHDGMCRILANSSACRIFSIDYRLAPEYPFPAAVEDSYVALRWIVNHAAELNLDPARIGVGGDSHGGTLAAVVCQRARDSAGARISFQLLICPVLDLAGTSPSREQFATGYFLDARLLTWASEVYCPSRTDLVDERVSPLRASDLAGLPPAYVHTAEFDPMRDEGRAYADALECAGVRVSYTCHPGMIHHFYAMCGAIPSARRALEEAGAALRNVLGD